MPIFAFGNARYKMSSRFANPLGDQGLALPSGPAVAKFVSQTRQSDG